MFTKFPVLFNNLKVKNISTSMQNVPLSTKINLMQSTPDKEEKEDSSRFVRLKTFTKFAQLRAQLGTGKDSEEELTTTNTNKNQTTSGAGGATTNNSNTTNTNNNNSTSSVIQTQASATMSTVWQRIKDSIIKAVEYFGPYDPESNVLWIWGMISVFFVIYNCLSIPLRVGFQDIWLENDVMHAFHVVFLVVDYLGDICFLIDIFLHFRTKFLEGGIMYSDTRKMALNYWSNGAKWDIIASLPLNFITFNSISTHALLRINCLIRLRRLIEYFEIWELHSKFSNLVMMLRLLGAILLYLHWLCCFYIGLSYNAGFGSSEWTPPAAFGPDSEATFWSLYLFGVFWATKMTTGLGGEIPAPETDLERAFTLLAAFMSLLIAGYIIGNIVNLIGAMNESSEEFRNKMGAINLYMKNKKVPEALTVRVRNYYNHLWSRQGGLDDTSIMDNLPARLKTEVSLHINGDIVAKVDLFKETNQGFRNALVEVLKPEIYTPGDLIIKQGDVGTEMYFISQGIVDVLISANAPEGGPPIEKKVAVLKEGAFFGEIALLLQSTRAATIRAQTYCDLYVLRKADLDRVLKSFPGERDIIVRKGMFKLLRDRLRRQLPKEQAIFVVSDEKKGDEPGQRTKLCGELVDNYQEVDYPGGKVIFTVNEDSQQFFFVGQGTVEFVDENDQIVSTITIGTDQDGIFVGLEEFLLRLKRKYTCRVKDEKTYIALWMRNVVDPIFGKYPTAVEQMCEFAATKKDFLPVAPTQAGTGSGAGSTGSKPSGGDKDEKKEKKEGGGEKKDKKDKEGGEKKEGGKKGEKKEEGGKKKKGEDKKPLEPLEGEDTWTKRFEELMGASAGATPEELLLACRLILTKINQEQ